MKKSEYYSKSKAEKVSKKCPIFDRCMRCAWTLYFLAGLDKENYKSCKDALTKTGFWQLDEKAEAILQIGGVVEIMGGGSSDSFFFANACPEVSLFENRDLYPYIPEKSITAGAWDNSHRESKYGEDKKFHVIHTGHFTDCREYQKFELSWIKRSKLCHSKRNKCCLYFF